MNEVDIDTTGVISGPSALLNPGGVISPTVPAVVAVEVRPEGVPAQLSDGQEI